MFTGAAILNCECRFKSAFIVSAKIHFPPYLRFKAVSFVYEENASKNKPVDANRFELILPLLLQLKPTFVDSRLSLPLNISNSEFDFVLAKLLPIFDGCKHFIFGEVECQPEEGSVFLASLLQHASIKSASSVEFEFSTRYNYDWPEAELPIEAISNWLHKPCVTSGATAGKLTNKMMEKRFLLDVRFLKIGNTLKMIKHLKKVRMNRQTCCIQLNYY